MRMLLSPFAAASAAVVSVAAAVALSGPPTPSTRVAAPQGAHVGTVFDRQGTALVRPVGRERWTPVEPRTRLQPGDQVRTDARGANAVEVELAGGGNLVLGPGGLIELSEAGIVRLYRGELALKPGETSLRARAPDFDRAVTAELILRSDGSRTSVLAEPPRWLTGYRSSTTDEWMGSLIAQVDGRDVPLTVGYHKVTVEIRDQIARTTIEESFVNTTRSTLEGQFFFPLPADASISGFGMWIGDELVEADIVEKQRARAIYEDILRNRKDPGLLEWSGGNLFKARVFPIFPHSEKRIRIRYTQVLPLEGTSYRYRYALRSDLLRQHPLRELAIQTVVSSTLPIDQVTCTSHEARVRKTDHAGSVEFDAQEFAPDRDFEVRVDLRSAPPLTVVPHRRGDDGYFMLLLGSPDPGGALQRELVPESGPLDLLLVADTSGSMDTAARATQGAFVAALLACLGPKDRFRLATADVDVHWHTPEATPATDERTAAALTFLDQRPSLGWTDLDRTFADVVGRAGPGTTVIYVGDGIGTAGDGDVEALGRRLRRLAAGSASTFHAVSTAATFERGVLEAIASIGGGSVRAADDDPARAAFGLLAEVAQPAVKDLRVAFEGLTTARVYPGRLPNLPAGRQQIVLGRFLPKGDGPQSGAVVVTGTLDGKPVRYRAVLDLAEDEEGNAFVPRLWARRHIDALLEQGRSPAIQEQIVAFSETFGVMTPFTSFLVLESDADRERYGVTRRVGMRDGEQFFADARDRASAELLRAQMQVARTWRLELRRQMRREIATLGRDLHVVALGRGDRRDLGRVAGLGAKSMPISRSNAESWREMPVDEDGRETEGDLNELTGGDDLGVETDWDDLAAEPSAPRAQEFAMSSRQGRAERVARPSLDSAYLGADAGAFANSADALRADGYLQLASGGPRQLQAPQFGSYFFPHLPPPPPPALDVAAPAWPAEVLDALAPLYRGAWLTKLDGGLLLGLRGGALHPLRGHRLSSQRIDAVLGSDGWLVRSAGRGAEPTEQYLIAGRFGVVVAGKRLGREREAAAADRLALPFAFPDLSLTDVVRVYAQYAGRVESTDGRTLVVVLTAPAPQQHELRLTIDRERAVLLEQQHRHQGKISSTTRYAAFEDVAGRWWPGSATTVDQDGRTVSRYELRVRATPDADANATLRRALDAHADVILVGANEPTVDAAKQAVADRRAGFAEFFALAIHFASSQQWDESFRMWDAAEETVADKPGATWLRAVLLAQGRRQQDLAVLLRELAPRIAETDGDAGFALAQATLALGGNALAADEMLELLQALRPAFERDGEDEDWRRRTLLRTEANLLSACGRARESLDLLRRLADLKPLQIDVATAYLDALWQANERQAALAHLDAWLDLASGEADWLDQERRQLFERASNWLWETRDLPKLHAVLERWIATSPTDETPYQRWLSTLLFLDRQADADAWVDATLTVPVDAPLDAGVRARVGAAVSYCLGQGWNHYDQVLDDRWFSPLADLARRALLIDDPIAYVAQRVLGDWRFLQSDAAATLRERLLADLAADGAVEAMPVERLGRYLGLIDWDRARVDATLWRRVADGLRARFSTGDAAGRATLAGYVLRVLDAHGEVAEALAFIRSWLETADVDARPDIARQLMGRLVQQDWTPSIEDELFALLPVLEPGQGQAVDRDALALGAVHWLAERLFTMRFAAAMGPAAEYEQLPRSALRARQTECRASARRELIARLDVARSAASAPYRQPLELERLCLAALLGEQLRQVDGEARELLFAIPAPFDTTDQILRERCAFVIAYCAMRRPSLGDDAAQLLRSLTDGDATDGADTVVDVPTPHRPDWRHHLFRLLLALDQNDALTATLHEWIEPTKVESRWRIAYGYLLAEAGRLAEAASAFEAVAATDELHAPEFAALADWYLVLHRDADRESALTARYTVMPEHELANRVDQEIYKLQGGGVPESLDPDVLRALRVLMGKATYPAHHIGRVQQLYVRVKDFRLLECLADGVLGHTEQAIYPFLTQVGNVTSNIHEEATCDVVVARIAALREQAKRDVDHRALLLLTMMIERRAAELLDAPGPHAARGLAAMRAAFEANWRPGERVAMATFLASLGRLPVEDFAAEQVRQLTELHRLEPAGGAPRLAIAHALAQTLWGYERHDAALDRLVTGLDELRDAQAGVLPPEADGAIQVLTGWYEQLRRFRAGETLLRAELAVQTRDAARTALQQRLFTLYVRCLERGGSAALGEGAELYADAREELAEFMFRTGPDQVIQALATFCDLHRAAGRARGVSGVGDDLQSFAAAQLPELLTRIPGNQQSAVSHVAQTIHELSGPRAGLAFLIDVVEAEPAVWARTGQGGFTAHGWMIAEWRSKAGRLGDLEPRLLKLVLQELERDLRSGQERNRSLYGIHHSYFWNEKAEDFLAVALRVIEDSAESPARLLHAADYLWSGLEQRERAVQVLTAAEARSQLREAGRHRLVTWLHELGRFGDALPLLARLVSAHPENLDYRVLQVTALHGVGRDAEAEAFLVATGKLFEETGRRSEQVLAVLANLALQCEFHAVAVAQYEELIPLHQRTQPNRGVGNGTLSYYYQALARACVALGRTRQAVDAASAAIVAWGADRGNRQSALEALLAVLRQLPDLDAYAATYAEEAARSGVDAPLLRKSLGRVFVERGRPANALPHLLAARELQPDDAETHRVLIDAYDQLRRPRDACAALLAAIDATPRNLDLSVDLGRRLTALGDAAAAERAFTNLVEVEPEEADGHRRLALQREAQARFADAVVQWQQVVRVRSDEPDGWLALAQAQGKAGDPAGARQTLQTVSERTWAVRFGDVRQRAQQMLSRPPR